MKARWKTRAAQVAVVVNVTFLLGCASSRYLPGSGPDLAEVERGAASALGDTGERLPYALVAVSPTVVGQLSNYAHKESGSLSALRRTVEVRPGVGDVIGVTLYEASSGGLFTSSGGAPAAGSNSLELPLQTVDPQGNITVPYAGAIRVAGRPISAIQDTIVDRLRNRAVEPQAIVSVREQRTNLATVLGDVNSPGSVPIQTSSFSILDAVAKAGGLKTRPNETELHFRRGRTTASINFARLVLTPGENIPVLSGDVLFLSHKPKSVVIVGAVGRNSRLDLDRQNLSLADALGKAEGLVDERADPGSVVLYRSEGRQVLTSFGLSPAELPAKNIPTIYRFNLADGQGYYLASKFMLRDGDLIFVGNTVAVEVSKLFRNLNTITTPVRDTVLIKSLLDRSVSGGVTITQ